MDLGVAIMNLTDAFPNNAKGWEIARQPIRAGTSIGANLCEADHALTDVDFAHKASLARKEAAETGYRLKIAVRAGMCNQEAVAGMSDEVEEYVRMVRKTQEHIGRSRPKR